MTPERETSKFRVKLHNHHRLNTGPTCTSVLEVAPKWGRGVELSVHGTLISCEFPTLFMVYPATYSSNMTKTTLKLSGCIVTPYDHAHYNKYLLFPIFPNFRTSYKKCLIQESECSEPLASFSESEPESSKEYQEMTGCLL